MDGVAAVFSLFAHRLLLDTLIDWFWKCVQIAFRLPSDGACELLMEERQVYATAETKFSTWHCHVHSTNQRTP